MVRNKKAETILRGDIANAWHAEFSRELTWPDLRASLGEVAQSTGEVTRLTLADVTRWLGEALKCCGHFARGGGPSPESGWRNCHSNCCAATSSSRH